MQLTFQQTKLTLYPTPALPVVFLTWFNGNASPAITAQVRNLAIPTGSSSSLPSPISWPSNPGT